MSSAVGEDVLVAVLVRLSKAGARTAGRSSLPAKQLSQELKALPLGQLLLSHCFGSDCGPLQQLTCLFLRRGPEQGDIARRRQAGTMGTSVFPCLFVILLTGGSPAGCAGDGSSASHSK